VLLALVEPKELLCFTLGDMGVEVVRGDLHPALRDWQDDLSLSDLFAAGVLG
jgi:hypothetical protein